MARSIPLNVMDLPGQRYSCHGCGDCCRDFTVQLREEDLERLQSQGYEKKKGESVTVLFRGQWYLRQQSDGACIFLESDGRCRIHAEHGFDRKPVACRLFPFNLAPDARGVHAGLNFACQSVRANKGATLFSHSADLKKALRELPEITGVAPPRLSGRLRATPDEVSAMVEGVDGWLATDDVDLAARFDGLAWLAQSLGVANFTNVRNKRVGELMALLVGALPEELELLPVEEASTRQQRLLRQAAFARIEDPRIHDGARRNPVVARLGQLRRSRRFMKGKGEVPGLPRDWPTSISFRSISEVRSITESDSREEIEDLIIRWARSTLRGGRAWGSGYYGFSVAEGIQCMVVNLACIGWLARVHAAGRGLEEVDPEAVNEALGRVDRTAGRARWLGSASERMRLKYFAVDDGLRRVVRLSW